MAETPPDSTQMDVRKYEFDDLSPRERQVLCLVYRLEVASVADIHRACDEEVSYNAVRRILDSLSGKSMVVHKREGRKYVYRPRDEKRAQGTKLLQHTIETFFHGSAALGFASLISHLEDRSLQHEEMDKLRRWLQSCEAESEDLARTAASQVSAATD